MLNFGTTKGGAQQVGPRRVEAPKGGRPNLEKLGPRRVGLEGWGLKGGAHRVGRAQNFALFFSSPATVFILFSLSWGSFR